MLGQIPCILRYPKDKTRAPARLEWQAQEVNPPLSRYSSLVNWIPTFIENIQMNPAVIPRKSGSPDNGSDTGTLQLQNSDWIKLILRNRRDQMCIRVVGEIQSVIFNVLVSQF